MDKMYRPARDGIKKPAKPAMAAKGPAPVGAKKPTPANQSIAAMLNKKPAAKPPVRKPEKNIMTPRKSK